jgi:hypothetical protein
MYEVYADTSRALGAPPAQAAEGDTDKRPTPIAASESRPSLVRPSRIKETGISEIAYADVRAVHSKFTGQDMVWENHWNFGNGAIIMAW